MLGAILRSSYSLQQFTRSLDSSLFFLFLFNLLLCSQGIFLLKDMVWLQKLYVKITPHFKLISEGETVFELLMYRVATCGLYIGQSIMV